VTSFHTVGIYADTRSTQGDKQLSRLGEALGGINDTSIGGSFVQRYADLDSATTINFSFGGVNITVPVSDLILPYNNTWAFQLWDWHRHYRIGLPFFRNAYTIFDYSHNQVSMAPLVQNSTSSNITTINENGVTGLMGVSLSSPSGSGGGGLSTGPKRVLVLALQWAFCYYWVYSSFSSCADAVSRNPERPHQTLVSWALKQRCLHLSKKGNV
jgi:hypothetical protein